jgi:2-polyprenyl-3-methyl-5-hydroxy-6-metoxy-1,4-benzoquinol methylase
VIVLSRYMREQYAGIFGLREEDFFLSRNGVDLGLFQALSPRMSSRDRRKLIFAARPERGLDVLLRHIMPRLLAADPRFRLYIAGYDHDVPALHNMYRQCHQLAAAFGDRVVHLGGLPKAKLYEHYLTAGAYVYPTPSPTFPTFREISCITAMECQAAGLPIVTSKTGALPETIGPGAGTLVDGDPSDASQVDAYADAFVDQVIRLANDDGAWETASKKGIEHAEQLSWDPVAEEWLQEFEDLLRKRNDSPPRLLRHFWRNSDIVAAKYLVARTTAEELDKQEIQRESLALLAPWSFMDEPEGYRKQYESIRATELGQLEYQAHEEVRFAVLEDWLRARSRHVSSILDYGCAHGDYAIALTERLPHVRVHGVDIDPAVVDMASTTASRRDLRGRASFSVWTHDSPLGIVDAPAGGFDCALLQEVLEHVPAPWDVIERVEAQVRPGGSVYITVPFGPWEYASYRTDPRRCHIWHFDAHDLRDMVGEKPDLVLSSCFACDNPLTGEPQGWWIASYTADHRPIPRVDLERHTWLQRPRQTVSAAILGGAASEEMLHWTLRSLLDLVDEIVIADCGMSAEGLRIAKQYSAIVVPGADPRREGFERARNVALDACRSDWCLWIDTDERLVGANQLEKYLRENLYQGYAIRQHNFSCDDVVSPDLPIRLFRRRPLRGRSLRFWGAIHEHPEFAVNEGAGPTICLPDVHIAHVGYLSEGIRRSRLVRNTPLLKLDVERYPNRLVQKYFIMRDNAHAVRFTLARNGGMVSEPIRAKCRETVSLYREHFLGTSHPIAPSALEYYSEALTVLDEGFEAAFQVEAGKDEAKTNGVRRFRFASTDDFNAELRRSVAEKAGRFDSKWW